LDTATIIGIGSLQQACAASGGWINNSRPDAGDSLVGADMQCCACGAMAVDRTPSGLDGIRIDCPHCGTYDVGSSVLDRLLRLDLPQRAEVLATAKRHTTKDKIPIVSIDCL
jgi:hypothetical protein